jgi:molybdopterin converting factor subunit 1
MSDGAAAAAAAATAPETVEVRVLFFARARELAGVTAATVRVPPNTTPRAALTDVLLPQYPALVPLAPHCALAVNLEYASADPAAPAPALRDGDELAVIPPISGG